MSITVLQIPIFQIQHFSFFTNLYLLFYKIVKRLSGPDNTVLHCKDKMLKI
jgi:hypothetical protein